MYAEPYCAAAFHVIHCGIGELFFYEICLNGFIRAEEVERHALTQTEPAVRCSPAPFRIAEARPLVHGIGCERRRSDDRDKPLSRAVLRGQAESVPADLSMACSHGRVPV